MRLIATGCVAVMAAGAALPANTQPAPDKPAQVFEIPQSGVTLVTGDSWVQNGQTLRLYGVQSCIRGTLFTNPGGFKVDCGEASLAYLGALIRDARPRCTPVAQMPNASIVVVCSATVGQTVLDLGTVLVTQGFAFASFGADRKPVYMPYMVAELTAKKARSGLWAAVDLPHPNSVIFGAMSPQQTR